MPRYCMAQSIACHSAISGAPVKSVQSVQTDLRFDAHYAPITPQKAHRCWFCALFCVSDIRGVVENTVCTVCTVCTLFTLCTLCTVCTLFTLCTLCTLYAHKPVMRELRFAHFVRFQGAAVEKGNLRRYFRFFGGIPLSLSNFPSEFHFFHISGGTGAVYFSREAGRAGSRQRHERWDPLSRHPPHPLTFIRLHIRTFEYTHIQMYAHARLVSAH